MEKRIAVRGERLPHSIFVSRTTANSGPSDNAVRPEDIFGSRAAIVGEGLPKAYAAGNCISWGISWGYLHVSVSLGLSSSFFHKLRH
jgi:hypothetical protein